MSYFYGERSVFNEGIDKWSDCGHLDFVHGHVRGFLTRLLLCEKREQTETEYVLQKDW